MAAEIVKRTAAFPSINATVRPGYIEPRELCVDISGPRGVAVTVNFNGASWSPDTYVLSWHFTGREMARFSTAFEAGMGPVNPIHRHKCTSIAYGWHDLVTLLARAFDLIESGAAFEPEGIDA